MGIELKTGRSDEALRKLKQLGNRATIQRIVLHAARRVGVKAEELAGEYPEPSGDELPKIYTRQRVDRKGNVTTFQSKFKSQKQQAYVILHLAPSKLIPYRRTGGLGASITSDVTETSRVVTVNVGTNKDYGPYVLGDEDTDPPQSLYHAGTWIPLSTRLLNGATELGNVLADELEAGVAAYLP